MTIDINNLKQEYKRNLDLWDSWDKKTQNNLRNVIKKLIENFHALENITTFGYPLRECGVHFEQEGIVYYVDSQAQKMTDYQHGYFVGYNDNRDYGNVLVWISKMYNEIGEKGFDKLRKKPFKGVRSTELRLLVPTY